MANHQSASPPVLAHCDLAFLSLSLASYPKSMRNLTRFCTWVIRELQLIGVTLFHYFQLENCGIYFHHWHVLKSFILIELLCNTARLKCWIRNACSRARFQTSINTIWFQWFSRGTVFWLCFGVKPDIFLPQQNTWSENSCPSFPNTQKERKMKKPRRELNMAKRYWKAGEASRTVRAPKAQVNPNRAINPMVLIVSLTTVFQFGWSLSANVLWIFLASTLITMTNMITLNSKMAKIGPR